VSVRILTGDCLAVLPTLPAESVQLVVTSPPYFALRSYLDADHPGKGHEIGSEPTPDAFVATMVDVFREVRRVLRTDGCCVINLGDSMSGSGKGPTGKNGIQNAEQRQGFESGYLRENGEWSRGGRKSKTEGTAGIPAKNLLMIPFRVALALQADGWILRSVMPWVKRNSMPESVQDRPATAVEYLFLLSKSPRYYWDAEAIRVPQAEPNRVQKHYSKGYTPGSGEMRGAGIKVHRPTEESPGYNPAGRSYRNSDPFFATWQGLMLDEAGDPLALVVNPQPNPLAHFATFPAGLVEPFVKAGTSEKGACPACGAPWRRTAERRLLLAPDGKTCTRCNKNHGFARAGSEHYAAQIGERFACVGSETTGWQPSCSCDAGEPRPCLVLDPFLGSGTTCLVAERLGRDSVGVELSPTYAEMARARIYGDAPMFANAELVS
jgi:DNA modification methylase